MINPLELALRPRRELRPLGAFHDGATTTLVRLSSLSAFWVRLGILPELIEPGKAQQNGRHERMHRTLKAETTRPPAGSRTAQQKRFNGFRQESTTNAPRGDRDDDLRLSL